jgi:hypothetical protein
MSAATPARKPSQNVPPPPPIPSYLAPQTKDFSGYKLTEPQLPCTDIPLAEPLTVHRKPMAGSGAAAAESTRGGGARVTPPPSSYLSLSQRLRTNQLAILRTDDPKQRGAHAVYYVDHQAIWQVDPPAAASADASATASGSSHRVYSFDSHEDGDGLSFVAVAPCFLLLTRAGGRLTIFHAQPLASSSDSLRVLFDGSPLCAAPRAPHQCTIQAAALSTEKDVLGVVLYEIWEERALGLAAEPKTDQPVQFVHASEADASAPKSTKTEASATQGLSATAASAGHKHTIHKLSLVQFHLSHIPGLPASARASSSDRNQVDRMADGDSGRLPSADLIHSFSSVQNHRLPRDTVPIQLEQDANWSAPLACWLDTPPESAHRPHAKPEDPHVESATPPAQPFLLFVIARVPYLNETESVVYEVQRAELEAKEAAREKLQPLDQIPRVKPIGARNAQEESKMDTSDSSAPSAAAAAASSSSVRLPFTSDKIESETHNLKHYAVDQEDDDADMDELGIASSGSHSLQPHIDASVQLFDSLGNLLAQRSFKQQTFLFAQVNGGAHLKRSHAVVGLKQQEELVLYAVSAAPQQTAEGLSLGAAGSVRHSSEPMAVPSIGIVLKPVFSFAGLGYVQGGKPFKKFFLEDGTHQYVILAEYAKHVYVYARPQPKEDTAPHWLLQMPLDEDATGGGDEARQIFGLQTVIVTDGDPACADATMSDATAAVQGQPLLYVLTNGHVRQYRLPVVPLPP